MPKDRDPERFRKRPEGQDPNSADEQITLQLELERMRQRLADDLEARRLRDEKARQEDQERFEKAKEDREQARQDRLRRDQETRDRIAKEIEERRKPP